MSLPLSGKVALVTGATSNIGRGIAERLAADGARVAVNYHRGDAAAHETVEAIAQAGGEAVALQADVSDVEAIGGLFAQAESVFGPVDVFVANAGLTPTPAPIAETTPEAYDRMFALNVRGVFFQLSEAANRLTEGGRIVVVSSAVTLANPPGLGIYSAGKEAVKTLVETLAKEVAERGVTVNSVLPGPTAPDAEADDASDEAGLSVFNRFGRPEDIAAAVAFLARDDARWVTGSHLLTSGGAFLGLS